MRTFEELRGNVCDGLVAKARADIRRRIVEDPTQPPDPELMECANEYERMAAATLDMPLETKPGNGGEIVALDNEMRAEVPGLRDALSQPPSVLEAVASRERMDAVAEAGAMTLGIELAQSVGAENSMEKMLAHQVAVAHRLALRFGGAAHNELQGYANCGHVNRSTEAARFANTMARLMVAASAASLTLQRLQQARQAPIRRESVSLNFTRITQEVEK